MIGLKNTYSLNFFLNRQRAPTSQYDSALKKLLYNNYKKSKTHTLSDSLLLQYNFLIILVTRWFLETVIHNIYNIYQMVHIEKMTHVFGTPPPSHFPRGKSPLKITKFENWNAHNFLSKRHMQLLSIFLESPHLSYYFY